jgi:hypothetical protein
MGINSGHISNMELDIKHFSYGTIKISELFPLLVTVVRKKLHS